jgi:hypothetical protein
VTPRLRDLLILMGAVAAAMVGGALLRFLLPPRWEVLLGVGLLFAAGAAVKLRWPNNSFLREVTWPYFLMVFVIVEAAILVLSDWSLLGYWTIPSAICLGLLYCILHLVLVGDDGRRRRS